LRPGGNPQEWRLFSGSLIFDVMFLVGFFQVFTTRTNLMLTKGAHEKIVDCRRDESECRFSKRR
jgi:hypothetical protein